MFILLLSVSAFFSGPLYSAAYILSFILPIAFVYIVMRSSGAEYKRVGISLSREQVLLTLPIVIPVLSIVFLISYLTSLILSLFSEPPTTDVSGNIFLAVTLHALMPSLLEELLFRLLPLAVLLPYGERNAILISSLMFSLVHANLFQIPYAFIAGVIFAAFDISFGSVLPSLLLHFLNNTISVIWMRNAADPLFSGIFIAAFSVGTVVSLIFIFIFRKKYRSAFGGIVSDKNKIFISPELVAMSALLILLTVLNLF